MDIETVDIAIIGAGLSGIYAATRLAPQKQSFVILEARNRIGGRILSPVFRGFHSDLGPSWYWPDIHPKMAALIQKLGLMGYRQFEDGLGRLQQSDGTVHTVAGYPMEPQSWRVHGGMMGIITRLCEGIPRNAVRLNHPVCKIEKKPFGIAVDVGELDQNPWIQFHARKIILALPPRLAAATILFEPELSHELTQAMLGIGTWMAGQAKFCALYEKPFWRQRGLSGQAFSQRGPMGELHDGSSYQGSPYGLTGFLGIPAVQRDHQASLMSAIILSQLASIYGREAANPQATFFKDWAREPFTATRYDQPPMLEHPLYHPPAGKTAVWNGRIHFAGTETARQNGGYLEGALAAAERAVKGADQKT
jgi:monoamine oxidase